MSSLRSFLNGTATKPGVLDILFAAVLPVICFVFDPVLTRGSFGLDMSSLLAEPTSIGLYVAAALCSIFFFLSYLAPGLRLAIGGTFTGGLLSLAIAVMLLPFSLIGLLFFGTGLLGLIPFVTSYRFFLRLRNLGHSRKTLRLHWITYLAGMLAVLLPAVAAYEYATRESEKLFAKLRSSSQAEVTANFHQLLNSWVCRDNCRFRVLYMVLRKELPMTQDQFEAEMSSILGERYRIYVDCPECVVGSDGD